MIDIATLIGNLGVMIVICGVFLYSHLEDRKDKKQNDARVVIALENSANAICSNSVIIKNTEEMHREMGKELAEIQADITEIREELTKKGETDIKVFEILERLENKVDELGKEQESERGD